MAGISPELTAAAEKIINPMLAVPPYTLGYPSEVAQSSYYLGDSPATKEEVAAVAKVMEKHGVWPENTRLRSTTEDGLRVFEILQATSAAADPVPLESGLPGAVFRVNPGDHAAELSKVCAELQAAAGYASNAAQAELMREYIAYFRTGRVEAFRQAQRTWVSDNSPRVEHIIGFMETYRDPAGARCEWESMVAISDPKETAKLDGLVQRADEFIRLLPWAVPGVNDGKGPFEPTRFDAPNFTIVHGSLAPALHTISLQGFSSSSLTDASSGVLQQHGLGWLQPAQREQAPSSASKPEYRADQSPLGQYSDIRENIGAKNIVFSNRLVVKAAATPSSPFVDPSEADALKSHSGIVHFIKNAIHELLGHGTGKMLSELSPGDYNFDPDNPPTNPLTGKPIEKWYQPGEMWKPIFGDLANTVEECRATLVSYYLPSLGEDVLGLFGFREEDVPEREFPEPGCAP